MKEFKEFIKNVFKNKRQRAIVSLLFWFFFFVIVFILMGGSSAIPKSYPTNESVKNNDTGNSFDNFKNMENFEYSFLITIKENNVTDMYKIEGTYYKDKYYFELDNNKYYINNNLIYSVNEDERKLKEFKSIDPKNLFNRIDFGLLTKKNIYTFISSSDEKSKTTYKDGSILSNLIYKSYDDRKIEIVVSEYSNIISNIDMDFKDYFDIKYDEFKVNITYKNINNIAEYDKNYDEYEITKEGE